MALRTLMFLAYLAAVETGWIEQAGGTVMRDSAARVTAVDLRASWITDSDMPALTRMPDLKRLDLSLTRISDRGLRALKTAPGIEELNLYFAEQVGDEGAVALRNWKHLKRLNPVSYTHLTLPTICSV